MKEMMTENYCDDCDDVLHATFNTKDFWNFKVGRIKCACGCIVRPCNECFGTDIENEHGCANCPWNNAEVKDAMTDEEYMRWCKKNEPSVYKMYKGNENGDYYHSVIAKIEEEDAETARKILKSFGYELYDVTEYGIFFRDMKFKATRGTTQLLMFKDWEAVKKYANEISK